MANVKDLLVNGSARIIGTIYGNATSATDSDKLDGKHLNEIASAKSTTLAWNTSSTIATIGGNNITVTMPANPNTDTHYTTGITAGATGTTSNSATTNGNTFIKIKDNSAHRGQIKLIGSGATYVSSDANGVITISSTDNNTTYGSMSVSEGTTGTATSNRVLTAANLKGIINAHAPTKTGGGASGSWGISISGNAATATKLATTRTIQTNLSSTTSTSFDGSANITPGVIGTLPVANGGTGVTSIAEIKAGKDSDGNIISTTYQKSCHRGYNSFNTPSSSEWDWYTIATISDSYIGAVILAIRAYAHTNLTISAQKGYWSNGSLVVLNYNSSSNGDYATISGVRLLTTGEIQLKIRTKCSNDLTANAVVSIDVNIFSSDGTCMPVEKLNVSGAVTDSQIIKAYNSLTNNGVESTYFIGSLTGTLTNARTFITALNSESAGSFNGSSNVTLGVSGILPVSHGGTGQNDLSKVSVGTAASCSGNAATASKVNNKLTVGSKTYDGSAAITIAASDLGLASAMLFLGTTTTTITDGAKTNPVAIGGSNKTVTAGNVVLYGSKEFVWTGSTWEELGNEGSYKIVQAAVGDPSASGTSNTFIATISQDANGKITATKKTVAVTNSAPTLSWGATSTIGTVAGTNLQVKMPANPNTWRGIQNNLTSDSTTDSLSAAQGKVLKGLVDGKAAASHTHDDRYYTESEIDSKLSGKANSSHTHNYAGSSTSGGSANSAVKLDSSAGSATQPIYFSGGKPVAITGTIANSTSGNAATATKATQDSSGQQINTTYIKGLSVSGRTITYTKGDGSTGTITTQDTNTTYSVATTSANGLMSSSDKSKLDGMGSVCTQAQIDAIFA